MSESLTTKSTIILNAIAITAMLGIISGALTLDVPPLSNLQTTLQNVMRSP